MWKRERKKSGGRERQRETRSVGADESNVEATEAASCGDLGNKSPSLLKVTNKPPSVTLRRHLKTFQAAVERRGRKGGGGGGEGGGRAGRWGTGEDTRPDCQQDYQGDINPIAWPASPRGCHCGPSSPEYGNNCGYPAPLWGAYQATKSPRVEERTAQRSESSQSCVNREEDLDPHALTPTPSTSSV